MVRINVHVFWGSADGYKRCLTPNRRNLSTEQHIQRNQTFALNTVIKQNVNSNSFIMHSSFTHCLWPFWSVMGSPPGVWASLWSVGPWGCGHSPVWAWQPLAGLGCFLCLVSLWASLGWALLHLCSPVGSSLGWVCGSLISLGLLAL